MPHERLSSSYPFRQISSLNEPIDATDEAAP
jgi:hypothetical protein